MFATFSVFAIFGQSPGLSVGRPPPTGSIPKAKSLSKAASSHAEFERAAQQIPVKSFEMAEIKNQAMAFRNRALVEGVWGQLSKSASVFARASAIRVSKVEEDRRDLEVATKPPRRAKRAPN